MRRPGAHRLDDRVHARPLATHRFWRHHRNFALDQDDHLMPGERWLRAVRDHAIGWVAGVVWIGWVVDRQDLDSHYIATRWLWGDFRRERQAALSARADAGFRVGREFGRQEVYDILERKLVDQEFPIR